MTLQQLNSLAPDAAAKWFETTCAATHWIDLMVTQRPYASLTELVAIAKAAWLKMNHADLREAFAAHPMIGDVNSLRAKFANTKSTAAAEQQGAATADEATLTSLSELNHAYLHKHGFIFIICATGLSAQTMLHALEQRLPNDTQTELEIAAEQQIAITLLRLKKALQNTLSEE